MNNCKRKKKGPRILTCPICGKDFTPPPEAHTAKYCSKACSREATRRQSMARKEYEKALKAGKAKRGRSAHRAFVLRREAEFRRAVDIKETVAYTTDSEGRRLRVVTRR